MRDIAGRRVFPFDKPCGCAMASYAREVLQLLTRLDDLAAQNPDGNPPAVLVPVWPKKKHAAVVHRGNRFTAADSREWFTNKENMKKLCVGKVRVGLLLEKFLVLDFDDKKTLAAFMDEMGHDVFDDTPIVHTNQGIHVYFMRSQRCDDLNITDRPLVDANKKRIGVDVKTITGSMVDGHYTRGFIMVPPSPHFSSEPPHTRGNGYNWAPGASLLTLKEVRVVPDKIVDWIVCFSADGHGNGAGASCVAQLRVRASSTRGSIRALGIASDDDIPEHKFLPVHWNVAGGNAARREDGSLRLKPRHAVDVSDARKMVASDGGDMDVRHQADWGCSVRWGGACHSRTCPKGLHNNTYQLVTSAKTGRRRMRQRPGSSCSDEGKRGVVIPYSDESLLCYQNALRAVLEDVAKPLAPTALSLLHEHAMHPERGIDSIAPGSLLQLEEAKGWLDAESGTAFVVFGDTMLPGEKACVWVKAFRNAETPQRVDLHFTVAPWDVSRQTRSISVNLNARSSAKLLNAAGMQLVELRSSLAS